MYLIKVCSFKMLLRDINPPHWAAVIFFSSTKLFTPAFPCLCYVSTHPIFHHSIPCNSTTKSLAVLCSLSLEPIASVLNLTIYLDMSPRNSRLRIISYQLLLIFVREQHCAPVISNDHSVLKKNNGNKQNPKLTRKVQ